MNTRILMTAAGLALAGSLGAQTITDTLQQLEQVEMNLMTVGIPVTWEAPLISGHPYSATARTITRSPDGKNVDRSTSEFIARDDQGRTRREFNSSPSMPGSDGGRMPLNISIVDPAAGVGYNLNVEKKVAMKRTLNPAMIENQTRVPNQSLLELARAQSVNRPNMTVEDLGTQVVNGVAAQGVRTTTTTPAGTFGNDRDLKTVVERWVSTDLHILVKSITTDSRSGPTTYELTNLQLGAPDPSLFQVPAGYTVQEGPGRGGRIGGTLAPAPTAGRK